MKYTWTEKGTRFNNKDYHFSLHYEERTGCVALTCYYGCHACKRSFLPNEERFIHDELDEMKEYLYNMEYN